MSTPPDPDGDCIKVVLCPNEQRKLVHSQPVSVHPNRRSVNQEAANGELLQKSNDGREDIKKNVVELTSRIHAANG
jgi:hypothetical protein